MRTSGAGAIRETFDPGTAGDFAAAFLLESDSMLAP